MNQPFLGTDPAFQLASALQAIEDAEKDWAVQRADHKERMERLYQEAGKLRYEILTGQKGLPLEPSGEKPLEIQGGGLSDECKQIIDDAKRDLQEICDESGTSISVQFPDGSEQPFITPKEKRADAPAD